MDRRTADAESDRRTADPVPDRRTADAESESRRLILNPTSGGGTHVEDARRLADEHGSPVVETEHAGHGADLAEEGVDTLAVCGGDGTLRESVAGLVRADALADVTLCVIPAGTENFFAGDLGVESMADGFAVADRGEARRLDLDVAGDEPFVLSAIAGLPPTPAPRRPTTARTASARSRSSSAA